MAWVDGPVPASVTDLLDLQEQVRQAATICLPATVAVVPRPLKSASGGHRVEASATGVIIREDGLILSQAHVTHRPSTVDPKTGLIELRQPGDRVNVVLHDGRRMDAIVLGADYEWDLSMLQIVEPGAYPFVEVSAEPAFLGQWAIKTGHPLGYRDDRGTVVRLGRILYSGQSSTVADCQTTGGDSGGPLVDLDGRLIGLAHNSEQPRRLQDALNKDVPCLSSLVSTLTAALIQPRIQPMVSRDIVRLRNYSRLQQLRNAHQDARRFLSTDRSTHGRRTNVAWGDMALTSKGSVVEVLRHGVRAAFGTVVGADGLIATKASEIDDAPQCRFHDGQTITATIVETNLQYDLALLQVPRQKCCAVAWSTMPMKSRGHFLMAPDVGGDVLAWGIVSVPEKARTADPPSVIHRAPVPSDRKRPFRSYEESPSASFRCDEFPIAFEHDAPLLTDQCGGPLVDLSGQVVGITIARSGPHGCLAIPSTVIQSLFPTQKNGDQND